MSSHSKEYMREYMKKYLKKNPDKYKKQIEYSRKNPHKYDRNKDNWRRLKSRYGISQEQYNEMLEKQGGVCAICLKPEKQLCKGKIRKLCVDHDHKTGKIRGLLCTDCNLAIGKLQDSPDLCRMAAKYLDYR